jgi:pimeloyl-ACP methyl ester carboxylesterase
MKQPASLRKLFSQGANATDGARDDALDATASDLATKANEADYKRLSKTPEQLPEFHKALSRMWSCEPQFTAEQLAAVKVPTAIVIADHGEWIKEEHARYITRTIPGAKVIILRNVSHYAAQHDPARYAQAVLHFVDGS